MLLLFEQIFNQLTVISYQLSVNSLQFTVFIWRMWISITISPCPLVSLSPCLLVSLSSQLLGQTIEISFDE